MGSLTGHSVSLSQRVPFVKISPCEMSFSRRCERCLSAVGASSSVTSLV